MSSKRGVLALSGRPVRRWVSLLTTQFALRVNKFPFSLPADAEATSTFRPFKARVRREETLRRRDRRVWLTGGNLALYFFFLFPMSDGTPRRGSARHGQMFKLLRRYSHPGLAILIPTQSEFGHEGTRTPQFRMGPTFLNYY